MYFVLCLCLKLMSNGSLKTFFGQIMQKCCSLIKLKSYQIVWPNIWSPQALRDRWVMEQLLTLASKCLRPRIMLAVELFPLPVFPSRTNRISDKDDDFPPGFEIHLVAVFELLKLKEKVTKHVPVFVFGDACLLEDDMPFLVACQYERRATTRCCKRLPYLRA